MSCEKCEFGIIMKVEVKVTQRDRQRFSKSLGDQDTHLREYRYPDKQGIYTPHLNNTLSNRGKPK